MWEKASPWNSNDSPVTVASAYEKQSPKLSCAGWPDPPEVPVCLTGHLDLVDVERDDLDLELLDQALQLTLNLRSPHPLRNDLRFQQRSCGDRAFWCRDLGILISRRTSRLPTLPAVGHGPLDRERHSLPRRRKPCPPVGSLPRRRKPCRGSTALEPGDPPHRLGYRIVAGGEGQPHVLMAVGAVEVHPGHHRHPGGLQQVGGPVHRGGIPRKVLP